MIEATAELPGVFAAMEAQRARAIVVLSAGANEGASELARAIAEAAARRARRAALLIDLDVERDTHFRHYIADGRRLEDFRQGVFNGTSFFRVGNAKRSAPEALERFMVARVGDSKLFVSHFEREGLAPDLRARFTPGTGYWVAARQRCDYCIVDAPARERSPIGVEVATALDGVVMVVSSALGSAAASLKLKSELKERGARVLGLVYSDADQTVTWLERWLARGATRKEAAP